jgi:ArsR family transcriptional regulator
VAEALVAAKGAAQRAALGQAVDLLPLAAESADRLLSVERARLLLRVLAEPIRLQVVQALAQGERCVCELTAELGLAQSKLSFHLRVMRDAGLLSARQQGRWIYYRLEPSALLLLQEWLGRLAADCATPAQPCP